MICIIWEVNRLPVSMDIDFTITVLKMRPLEEFHCVLESPRWWSAIPHSALWLTSVSDSMYIGIYPAECYLLQCFFCTLWWVHYVKAEGIPASIFQNLSRGTFHFRDDIKGEVKSAITCIFLVQVRLRTEVLRTPSSTWPGFELMTSRSW